jgi:hypothetical protein
MSLDRRRWLSGVGASLAGVWLAGCDRLVANSTFNGVLKVAETWTLRAQRLDRKSTRLNSSHNPASRMPSSA